MSETGIALATLDADQCRALLVTHRPRLGRLAFVDGEWPIVLPVNFALDGDVVYFRTAAGSKLDAAVRCDRVAFQLDRVDEVWEEGWSVLAFGHLRVVDYPDEPAPARRLRLRPWASGDKPHYLRLEIPPCRASASPSKHDHPRTEADGDWTYLDDAAPSRGCGFDSSANAHRLRLGPFFDNRRVSGPAPPGSRGRRARHRAALAGRARHRHRPWRPGSERDPGRALVHPGGGVRTRRPQGGRRRAARRKPGASSKVRPRPDTGVDRPGWRGCECARSRRWADRDDVAGDRPHLLDCDSRLLQRVAAAAAATPAAARRRGQPRAGHAGHATVATRRQRRVDSGDPKGGLVDRAAPASRAVPADSMNSLNRSRSPLGLPGDDIQEVADLLHQTLGLVLQVEPHERPSRTERLEVHRTSVRSPGGGRPRDLTVGDLLQDGGVPLPPHPRDLGNPVRQRVPDLPDFRPRP